MGSWCCNHGTWAVKIINLFAGPGAGKSTMAMYLSAMMKTMGLNVEYVTEYAKDLTWEKRFDILADQLYVLAKQNRKLNRLEGQVDYVVTDSPLLLSEHYRTPDYLPKSFQPMIFELWEMYDNENFFIHRVKPYKQVGRTQSEEEAKEIDGQIRKMLIDHAIPFKTIVGDSEGPSAILRNMGLLK